MNLEIDILELNGSFTWMFGELFFIETTRGNFIWSDPDYGGDNTLKKYNGSYRKFLKETGTPFGRDKGTHVIKDYCGNDVKVIS